MYSVTTTDAAKPKLSISRPRGRSRTPGRYWHNGQSLRDFEAIRQTYENALDQEVAASPIVRRALAFLAEHLRDMARDDKAALDAEIVALMRTL